MIVLRLKRPCLYDKSGRPVNFQLREYRYQHLWWIFWKRTRSSW